MAGLKEFQIAAVDRIVKMLETNGSRRFLLADEVGLGKTLIARGVIEKIAEQLPKKCTVVYLCSNLEIAAQNAEKLSPKSSSAVPVKGRLTLLPLNLPDANPKSTTHIYSFTPGTSLNLGRSTGIKRERRLLLYLFTECFGQRLTGKWKEFFRGGAGEENWLHEVELGRLRSEFDDYIKPSFRDRWGALVRRQKVKLHVDAKDTKERNLWSSIEESVDQFWDNSGWLQRSPLWIRRNRNTVVSELRKCLAMTSLAYLKTSLVVMDEFQKFKDILDNSRNPDSVEAKLLSDSDTKVLILSATPYKMYTLKHEAQNHHEDFLDTYAFLNDCPRKHDQVKRLEENLSFFRQELEAIDGTDELKQSLIDKKNVIETDLQRVMCRTERNRYIADVRKGVTEIPVDGEADGIYPRNAEMSQYIELRRFLLQDENRAKEYGRSIMDFWKSGPSLLSFMDGHYALIKKLRENNERIPQHLLLSEPELRTSHLSNLKFRQLFSMVLDAGVEGDATSDVKSETDRDWPFLWIKPRFTYYQDHFYKNRSPRKMLVFSHWYFVPKTVAFLTSSEVESRLRFDKDDFASSRLTFKKGMGSIFNVAFPSLALASEINPVQLSRTTLDEPDQQSIEGLARKRILELLAAAGVTYRRSGPSAKPWELIARLDASYCDKRGEEHLAHLYNAIHDQVVVTRRDDQSQDWFGEFKNEYLDWLWGDESNESRPRLSINEKRLKEITDIALYSPTISILRSVLIISPRILDADEGEIDLLSYVANVGVDQIRNYFNRPIVQAIVMRFGNGKRYIDRVLDYCGRAHLQAVLDEYTYLLEPNVSADSGHTKAQRLVEHIGSVFSMHAGSPRVNQRKNGRIHTDHTLTGSAHFALAFGDDTHVEHDGQADHKSRKSDVRNAFNSPFWPFVLATTSVGQEGLDFHLYCKDIAHWNLPSNPVDLEQREGRLNRFNSLAIRDMICRDYPLRELPAFRNGSHSRPESGLPWQWVFDEIESEPFNEQTFKQGLFPHWIYVPKDGKIEILRRHLMFYSNSRDVAQYQKLKRDLSIYRLVFGQPRQQDIVRRIRDNFGGTIDEDVLNRYLPAYMINLSPYTADAIWKFAVEKAKQIIESQSLKARFLETVKRFVGDHETELQVVANEIDALMEVVARQGDDGDCNAAVQAAAALYYMVNPYDDICDFYTDIGFSDDIKIIKQVYSSITDASSRFTQQALVAHEP